MSMLSAALHLASKDFEVFPLIVGRKTPPDWMKGYTHRATKDLAQIVTWWGEHPNCNVGISTSKYRDGHLLVIDVDNKPGKDGNVVMSMLRAEGFTFPDTYAQQTPSGGYHLFYFVPFMCRNSGQELGCEYFGDKLGFSCIDTRGAGGLVVGAGSRTAKGVYTGNALGVALAPAWLAERFRWTGKAATSLADLAAFETEAFDAERSNAQAIRYLQVLAPAQENGRNEALYRAACWLKDLAVLPSDNRALILEHWKCSPPLDEAEVERTVANAYKYGQNARGAISAEVFFKPVPSQDPPPVSEEAAPAPDGTAPSADEDESAGALSLVDYLNKSYAFCLIGSGSCVLWETKNHKGQPSLRTLTIDSFRNKIAGEKLIQSDGEKKEQYKVWLYHNRRRSYDALVFHPGRTVAPNFYNLWQGFAYTPLLEGEKPKKSWEKALDDYLLHVHQNAARGNAHSAGWILAWFAHCMQRPWEQPKTSLVFQGGKGVGKNAVVERPGALLGQHYMGTSKRRFLVGQFNAHLENKLMFCLNEAFWAHDAAVEAVLKELVTEPYINVERKHFEQYDVDNFMRIIIMGNDDTIVPASYDERRWAVFKVGDGHKQNMKFFHDMRVGMEDGGYRLLLRYLLEYDWEKYDIREAPNTEGLHEQKLAGLDPFHQWWHECLVAGRIVASDFPLLWKDDKDGKPFTVNKDVLRLAFRRYRHDNDIRMREPHAQIFGKRLKECTPSADGSQKILNEYVYRFPSLEAARREWDTFIKFAGGW